jgi:hypothetical protein
MTYKMEPWRRNDSGQAVHGQNWKGYPLIVSGVVLQCRYL